VVGRLSRWLGKAHGPTGAARNHLPDLIPRVHTRYRYDGDERPPGVRPGLLLPGRVSAQIPVSSFRGAQRRGIQAAVIVRFSKASGDERPLGISGLFPLPEPLNCVHNGGNPAKAKGDDAALSKSRHAPFCRQPRPVCGRRMNETTEYW